jgi:hypothetical protein
MIIQAAVAGALILLIAIFLTACASPTNDTLSSPSASQSGSSVPGEKMDDDRFSPGPMGSGNVRW